MPHTGREKRVTEEGQLLSAHQAIYSEERLQRFEVRAHNLCDTTDLSVEPQLVHRRPSLAPGLTQRLQGNIKPNFRAVFEAVRDGFGKRFARGINDTHW